MKMLNALDLYCGAGGASYGIREAGLAVIGVDIAPQPEYPYRRIQCDVLDLPPEYLRQFDLIWASPPCQAYSWSARRWDVPRANLVGPTRDLLGAAGVPYVIENVPAAPIRPDLVLTGPMFGLRVIRRRAFEIEGFWCLAPPNKVEGSVRGGEYVTVAGHGGEGKASLAAWQEAMGIKWITDKHMLAEAVPPAYSRYIAQAFKRVMDMNREGSE